MLNTCHLESDIVDIVLGGPNLSQTQVNGYM